MYAYTRVRVRFRVRVRARARVRVRIRIRFRVGIRFSVRVPMWRKYRLMTCDLITICLSLASCLCGWYDSAGTSSSKKEGEEGRDEDEKLWHSTTACICQIPSRSLYLHLYSYSGLYLCGSFVSSFCKTRDFVI